LAFLAAAPAAAPAVEELLLPMSSARSTGCENGCGRRKQLLQNTRRKTVAAE
jgi:hypothetical protein